MGKRDEILAVINSATTGVTGQQLVKTFGISRQAINKHIKNLLREGLIQKQGSTRAAIYLRASTRIKANAVNQTTKKYRLESLEEDRVFQELSGTMNLRQQLSERSRVIVHYAFTEILNNAIDHSKSETGDVRIQLDAYDCVITIRDFGIGVFENICHSFGLADELSAAGELIKGKTTTMAERHSGEGLFFTSKAVDVFTLRSHGIELKFDNKINDIFLAQKKFIKGTEAQITISRKTKKILSEIFQQFAPEEFDYEFQQTKVQVKLFADAYISRSEAKRLLANLDRFRKIILDFKGVKSIGQGFADEVFRVFKNQHANSEVQYFNCIPEVEAMIRHVVDN